MFSPEGMPPKKEQVMNPEVLAKWETLKKGHEYNAVVKGRQTGIPDSLINDFIQQKIADKLKEKNYTWVSTFMKATGSGTEEEIKRIKELAFKQALEQKEYIAIDLAEKLYGKDSDQYQKTAEVIAQAEAEEKKRREEIERKLEGKDIEVEISPNATIADLGRAVDRLKKKIGIDINFDEDFDQELWDNFDNKVLDEFVTLRDSEESKKIKLLDFFKKHGYGKGDVESYLPIKFKKARKKK
jgi:hypothetical protein